MPGSFSVALSGLNADTLALDVVGNNLANLNTTGFKGSSVSFQDLVSQSIANGMAQIGQGVGLPITSRNFTQGSIQLASGSYNAAIQGNGFFQVTNSQGNTLYTRAGDFHIDATGNLVTATGDRVQGWTAVNGVLSTTGATGDITIPASSLQTPAPTQNFSLDLNLNAAAAITGSTSTFAAPIQVVDSLGQKHTLTVTFTKTAANSWNYDVGIPGEDLASGTAGTPTSVGNGTLTFDSSGKLTSPAPPDPVALTVTGLTDGAADMALNWNIFNPDTSSTITQFAQTSALSGSEQDGLAAAQVTQVAIGDGGQIVAQYSNGTKMIVAQLALASIANPESLIAVGNNNYEVGVDTATPAVGTSGTGNRGTIEAGALESSTVDIAQEFTNLIVYQRSYQANSRVITTLDELTQDLLSMKR